VLSTKKLKEYILDEITPRLGDMACSDLFFCEGKNGSPEGIYVFQKNGKYFVSYSEKGSIFGEFCTTNPRDVLWEILNGISSSIAIEYAKNNRVQGQDFRRTLFRKEIEIMAEFGEDFKERKKRIINNILERFPYNDCSPEGQTNHGTD